MNRTLPVKAFLLILLVVSFAVSNSFAQTFTAKTDLTGGTTPTTVATGDLNGDGKIDLAMTNNGSATVSVFLNNTTSGSSTPTFSAKTDFTTGTAPLGVTIGDINGDGKPDMVVGNLTSVSVSVFINTTATGAATPTFSAKVDFAMSSGGQQITLADINGDGKPDIIAASNNSSGISIFLNTTATGAATPTFAARTDLVTTGGIQVACIADFNGDGKPDIACQNSSGNVLSVFFNTTSTGAATATFSAKTNFTTPSLPRSVAAADINGDGKPDMISANAGAGTISVFLNTTSTGAATPTFSASTDFTAGSGPRHVVLSDLNCDGKLDIVVSNESSSTVSILLNTTAPGASTPVFNVKVDLTPGGFPFYLASADFNGDGKPDLAIPNNGATTLSVFFNTSTVGVGAPSFSAKTDFAVGISDYTVSIGDLNGDGKLDLVSSNASGNSASVLLNTMAPGALTPSFSAQTVFTTGVDPEYLSIGDLNGDGKPDLVSANYTPSSSSVLLNTTTPGASTPTFTAKTDFTLGSHPFWISLGDINADGKLDLVSANSDGPSVSVLINTTTPGALVPTFTAKTDFTSGVYTVSVQIADFNGDGKPDLVTANGTPNTVSVFFNTTIPGSLTPTFSAKTDFTTGTGPGSVVVGDFNGDGKKDLVTGNANVNTVSVLLNTTAPGASTPSFSAKTDFAGGGSPFSVEVSDVNNDGKPDIIETNWLGTTISVLLNTTTTGAATPTFAAKVDFTVGSGPTLVALGDFNGDGKKDLTTANVNNNNVSVLLNSILLPVELASFTSSVNGNNVTLNWNTVSEQNNSGFDVERNSYGTGWTKVGFVGGHGTINLPQSYTFADNSLNSGRYSYRIRQMDYNGNYEYFELQNEVIIGVPVKNSLNQNYPNPFNPVSVIEYQIPVRGFVSLKVFDISGREVNELVNEIKDAGYYSITFNASALASGTYFYKLSAGDFESVKKMVVVK